MNLLPWLIPRKKNLYGRMFLVVLGTTEGFALALFPIAGTPPARKLLYLFVFELAPSRAAAAYLRGPAGAGVAEITQEQSSL